MALNKAVEDRNYIETTLTEKVKNETLKREEKAKEIELLKQTGEE